MERINSNGLLRLFLWPSLHGFQIDSRKERANDGLCTCKAEALALAYFLSFIPVLGREMQNVLLGFLFFLFNLTC
jgi:hypothetical protein